MISTVPKWTSGAPLTAIHSEIYANDMDEDEMDEDDSLEVAEVFNSVSTATLMNKHQQEVHQTFLDRVDEVQHNLKTTFEINSFPVIKEYINLLSLYPITLSLRENPHPERIELELFWMSPNLKVLVIKYKHYLLELQMWSQWKYIKINHNGISLLNDFKNQSLTKEDVEKWNDDLRIQKNKKQNEEIHRDLNRISNIMIVNYNMDDCDKQQKFGEFFKSRLRNKNSKHAHERKIDYNRSLIEGRNKMLLCFEDSDDEMEESKKAKYRAKLEPISDFNSIQSNQQQRCSKVQWTNGSIKKFALFENICLKSVQ